MTRLAVKSSWSVENNNIRSQQSAFISGHVYYQGEQSRYIESIKKRKKENLILNLMIKNFLFKK